MHVDTVLHELQTNARQRVRLCCMSAIAGTQYPDAEPCPGRRCRQALRSCRRSGRACHGPDVPVLPVQSEVGSCLLAGLHSLSAFRLEGFVNN